MTINMIYELEQINESKSPTATRNSKRAPRIESARRLKH